MGDGAGGGISVGVCVMAGMLGVAVTWVGVTGPVVQALVRVTPNNVINTIRSFVREYAVIKRWFLTRRILTHGKALCKQLAHFDH